MSRSPRPHDEDLSPLEVDVLAAHRLSEALRAGSRPQPIASGIALGPGEAVYAHAGVQILQHTGAQVAHSRGGFLALGNPMLMAATVAGSVLYNRHSRKKAEARAAPQWRPVDDGLMYLTNSRIALQARSAWIDLPYSAMRATHCDADGLVVYWNGEPPVMLRTWCPGWHYVLMRFLAYGEIVPVVVPDALERHRAATMTDSRALPPGT